MHGRSWAVVLVVLLVPGAAANACQEVYHFSLGVDRAEVTIRSAYWGSPAADVRAFVEQHGDGDGVIEASDVDAFEAFWGARAATARGACSPGEAFLHADGAPFTRVQSIGVDVSDVVGTNTGDTEALRTQVTMHLVFAAQGDATVWTWQAVQRVAFAQAMACVFPDLAGWDWGDHACGTSNTDLVPRVEEVSMRAAPGHAVRATSVSPGAAGAADDGGGPGFVARSVPPNAALLVRRVTFEVVAEQQAPASVWWPLAAAGVGVAALGVAFAVPHVRYRVPLWLLPAAFFTRLREEEVRGHGRRAMLLSLVEQQPGIFLAEIRATAGLAAGVVSHHLRVLERHGLVRSERDGGRTRFFAPTAEAQPADLLTSTQRELLALVRARPGATQAELAQANGTSRHQVAYQLRQLQERGLVEARWDGPRRRHWPVDP